jgi:REP element-mobilizing transposase RayT
MDQFKNKYRIPSARAQWWDYGNDAAYFITICTKNRSHFFGKITDQKLFASPAGDIAANIWHEIPANFPYAQLGAFVVMPNHVHGIIIIEKTVSDVAVPLHPASQSKSLFRILSPDKKCESG